VVIKYLKLFPIKISHQASPYVLISLVLYIILNGVISNAQSSNLKEESFEKIQSILDKEIGSFERGEALISINELLLENYDENQKDILKVYKLKALVATGLLDEALQLANDMLTFNELDAKLEVSVLLERALLHEILQNLPESKKDLNRVARIYEQTSVAKEENYGRYLSRLSSWYRVNGRYLESMDWAKKAVEFGEQNDYLEVEATGYLLMGFNADSIDIKQKRFFFNKGLQLWKQGSHEPGAVDMYVALASTYLIDKKLEAAMVYNDSALKLIDLKETNYERPNLYNQRSIILEKQGKVDSALLYQKRYAQEQIDELIKSRDLKVREYEFEYKKEKAVLDNIRLETELEDSNRKENYLIYGLIGLALFLISLGLLFIALAARNRKINDQNSSIKKTNFQLSQTIKEKEFLLQEVNHRVKNNLAFIQSLIAFQMDESTTLETTENLKSLNYRIQAIATVHDQFVEANEDMAHEEVPIKSYLAAIADALIQVNGIKVKYNQDIGTIKVNLETAVPIGILINELMTNSLKHAKPVSGAIAIQLQITSDQDRLLVLYNDNGAEFIAKGDDQSLGLYIVRTMVKQLHGTLERNGSNYQIMITRKKTA
jgi:two-component sensor histidine kinase